jgi:serine/threonine-protein kinase
MSTSRITAALAGHYAIERELGQGGMATVYLARDVKHDRQVALKVLRPELAAVIGAERFLNEIKVTANLQHPHILPLHDSGEADSFLYYVMPFVEGETLRGRIDREKQLSVKDAVEITKHVAAALDYAHRQGVIHRDIKPENVLIHDGQALVADFGIALAVSQAGGSRLTETGLSIGTPHYMSPEQAMGDRELDARSDVYSLGAMLYEMLTGEPPYTGATAQAIVARVITEDPRPITVQRRTAPRHVAAAVHQALSKLPADRFGSAADFAQALEDTAFGTATTTAGTGATVAAGRRARWSPATIGLAVVAVLSTTIALWLGFRTPPAPAAARPVRFLLSTDAAPIAGQGGRLLAVAPDGRALVYVGVGPQGNQLFMRRTEALGIEPLPGTENGRDPVFSPDGEWLAFTQGNDIKRVRTTGGSALTVARGVYGAGGGIHWGPDGSIVFTPAEQFAVGVVPGTGGDVTIVAGRDSTRGRYRWPHLLPGGRWALVTLFPNLEQASIGLLDLETGAVEVLVQEGAQSHYVSTGHIVYGHGSGSILTVPFDIGSRQVTGQPTTLLDNVQVFTGGATQFASSAVGTAAYMTGSSVGESLVLLDNAGQEIEELAVAEGNYEELRFAPDGTRIALIGTGPEGDDVQVYDLRSRTLSRLSTEGGNNDTPAWDPVGEWLWYAHQGADTGASVESGLRRRRADGSGNAEAVLPRSGLALWVSDVGLDGQVVYSEFTTEGRRDLFVYSPADSAIATFLQNPWDEGPGLVSPDGRWIAYESEESGRSEIYVTSFPTPGGRTQISQGGGDAPQWDPDGTGVFYITASDSLARAALAFTPGPSVVDRRTLFSVAGFDNSEDVANYSVHPAGNRFVVIRQLGQQETNTIVVVVNWFEELRAITGQ